MRLNGNGRRNSESSRVASMNQNVSLNENPLIKYPARCCSGLGFVMRYDKKDQVFASSLAASLSGILAKGQALFLAQQYHGYAGSAPKEGD